MTRRAVHYEAAFEAFLRARKRPYVAVDEARKTLLPPGRSTHASGLKSFDFLLPAAAEPRGEPAASLIVEIKGRRWVPSARSHQGWFDPWVTREDVEALLAWEGLFGSGVVAAFVFVLWCPAQPPDGLFADVLRHRGRWYALQAIRVRPYRAHMRPRSPRWATVTLDPATAGRLTGPLETLSHGLASESAGPSRGTPRAAGGGRWRPAWASARPTEPRRGTVRVTGAGRPPGPVVPPAWSTRGRPALQGWG